MESSFFIRNYAAGVVGAVKKWFWDPYSRGKSSKVSVLEANSFEHRYDSIIFHEFVNLLAGRVISSKILEYLRLPHTERDMNTLRIE